jgi:hypothetical protein
MNKQVVRDEITRIKIISQDILEAEGDVDKLQEISDELSAIAKFLEKVI